MTKIDKYTFYSALILALRERCCSFVAEGKEFHQAFMSVVEKIDNDKVIKLQNSHKIMMDPVFIAVNEASEMILEAIHDRILLLTNNNLGKAIFNISVKQASKELQNLNVDTSYFRELAQNFIEILNKEKTIKV